MSAGGWRAAAIMALSLGILLLAPAWAAEQGSAALSTGSPPTAVPAYRQANNVAVLNVEGTIDRITLQSLERRMKKAVKNGADAVVIEINTPGGEMEATLDICNLLKDRGDTPANVVAWIHPQAYSAGTIIALACREIVVAPGATFGDAAPIAIDPFAGFQQLQPTERAKALAPIFSEIIDSARRSHYDEKLVQTFVALSDGLWMIENIESGERAFVDLAEYRRVFGDSPSPQPLAPPPTTSRMTGRWPVLPSIDQTIPRPGDKAGLTPEQVAKEAARDQLLPPARKPLSESDRGKWRLVRQVIDSNNLLTVKADEAMYYGLATAAIANDADLKAYFAAQNVTHYRQSWSESLVRVLVSFWVRALLIIIFIIALFIALAAPGMGVFEALAGASLLLLIGAPALAGMADWWEIILIGLGLLLVATEIFILPGLGVAGVAGVVCLLVGIVGTFVSGDLDTSAGQNELWTGLLTTLLSVFAACVGVWLISRQMHSFPVISRYILNTELGDGEGGRGVGLLEAMAGTQTHLTVGDLGTADTDLRPSGRATFDGRLVDVKSVGSYIDKGAPVRILTVGRFVTEVEEAT